MRTPWYWIGQNQHRIVQCIMEHINVRYQNGEPPTNLIRINGERVNCVVIPDLEKPQWERYRETWEACMRIKGFDLFFYERPRCPERGYIHGIELQWGKRK